MRTKIFDNISMMFRSCDLLQTSYAMELQCTLRPESHTVNVFKALVLMS